MKLVIASNNQHKLEEFRRLLMPLGIEAISQKEADVDIEIDETGTTFEENARLKAKGFYDFCKTAVIADDSGLAVDCLNGAPGVFSARYSGENATDITNYQKLLCELEGVETEQRTARFVCVIHLILADGAEHTFRGTCEGVIGDQPLGAQGFGYDPIFMVGDKSFAQLSGAQKDAISHRGKAMKELEAFLKKQSKDLRKF